MRIFPPGGVVAAMAAVLVAPLLIAPLLSAQAASEAEVEVGSTPSAQGHAYFGFAHSLGDATNLSNLGAGGERFLYKGLAAGGDLGYVYTGGRFGYGLGLGAANLSYHFRGVDPDGHWVPFVTGGYAVVFRDGAASLANYGGGVTWWFRPHWGARLEVRQFQRAHLTSLFFRFGISFR